MLAFSRNLSWARLLKLRYMKRFCFFPNSRNVLALNQIKRHNFANRGRLILPCVELSTDWTVRILAEPVSLIMIAELNS